MPIFPYFAAVGSVLLGLLFLTDAMLPARGPLGISTEFHGLSVALHGEPAPVHAPALVAPEPDMKSDAVKLASEGAPAPAVNVEPVNPRVVRAEPAPKKRKRIARPREWRDQYAQAQDFGWNSNVSDRRWQLDWDSNDRRRGSDLGSNDRRWRW